MSLQLGLRLGLLSGGFTPASLFAAGEQGYWLDPSDFSTMFQDAAGTTPVTATGQSVRLMLDKSKGLVLGPELVTNGDFSGGATGWTNSSTGTGSFSVSGGAASITGADASNRGVFGQSFTTVVGRTYVITFTASGVSGSTLYGPSTSSGYSFSLASSAIAAGAARLSFVATTTTTWVNFAAAISSAGAATLNNISVRELAGNHFTQANVANAPILGVEPFGGRRNLLTFTEQFDNAAWVLQGAGTGVAPTRTLGAGTSPAGVTACRLQFSLGGGTTTTDQSIFRQSATVPSGAGVFSVWLRSTDGTSSYVMQLTDPSGNGQNITVTGTWQRFQVTGTSPGTAINYQLRLRGGQTPANSNTADVLFSEPQVETGSTATAYQRVVTAFDVTQAGVADCYYLSFDGTDDWLVSPTITPGIDKAQVFAGVRKLSAATFGMPVDFGNLGTGSLAVQAPGASADNYEYYTSGTTSSTATASGYPAPITNVISGLSDIASDSAVLRVNGAQAATSALDQGTGNYLAYPLYVGRRGGVSRAFNGRIYQMVMRFGPNLTAGQITQTEAWVNSRTGAY